MVEHSFGGPWTEIKLDAVEYYLECYTKALKHARFDLSYIDAFAGTGDREAERVVGGLFDGKPIETITETLRRIGSTRDRGPSVVRPLSLHRNGSLAMRGLGANPDGKSDR